MSNPSARGITVVIPAYNASAVLRRAIESAWDVPVQEVIVIDDGSEDLTAHLARQLGCVVIVQANSGAAVARQRGASLAKQPFTILLDADDALHSQGVLESLRLAISDESYVGVLGATRAIIRDGLERLMIPWPEGVSSRSLLERGMTPGPPGSFLWKTAALKLSFSEHQLPVALKPRYAEDYEITLRMSLIGPIHSHDLVSCEYAVGGGKSSKAPLASNMSAERIRRYYADIAVQKIRIRGEREIVALGRFRTAYGEADPIKKAALVVLATVTSSTFFRSLIRAISRKIYLWTVGKLASRTPKQRPKGAQN